MSLNKFMHPRNKYRRPPDFKALAIKYPEFRKHAKQAITGKVSVDFKNLESLRALTLALLKDDFNLDVEIPLNRLIPTLPLRLNYLLWIEDVLAANARISDVIRGIDIGCGASCIYPLLAAQKFQWHMLATEMDTESAVIASNNVKRNNLNDKIKVQTVPEGTMLEGVLEADIVYDFCMCNPPFFSSTEELDPQNVSRSPNRPLPRNAQSGAHWELVAPGGEVAFVKKIIQDSLKLKESIRVYSVMLGHKTSVGKVQAALKEAGIERVTSQAFCQGHTTRWGVAWTLGYSVILKTNNKQPQHKPSVPFSHTCDLELQQAVEKLIQLLGDLQMTYKTLSTDKNICKMQITAFSNTWCNSRKKRRQEKMKQATNRCNNNTDNTEEFLEEKTNEDKSVCQSKSKDQGQVQVGDGTFNKNVTNSEVETSKLENANNETTKNSEKNIEMLNSRVENKRTCDEDTSNNPKRKKVKHSIEETMGESKKEPIFIGTLVTRTDSQGAVVELNWLRGSGGRDSAHQILQYFKNNLKTH